MRKCSVFTVNFIQNPVSEEQPSDKWLFKCTDENKP